MKRVVADGDRRDVILTDMSQWESRQKKREKEVRAARKELFKTLQRKDATRSEAEPIMAKLDKTFLEMD
jgi:hypothetical protein